VTTAALQLTDDARWLTRAWHHTVVIPARAVGQWAAVALITSGTLYGVLYILGHYKVIPALPTPEQAIWLALAHIVPLIVLLFLYTLCKRDYLVEARAERETAAAAAQVALDAQAALRLDWQRQQLEIETAQQQLEIEAGHVRLERARAKIAGSAAPVKSYQCPTCGKELTAQQHSVNQRYGGSCKECRHT